MPVNSANCRAYCVVNAAGMCCTRITAAGKSFVNPGASRITVAGPPVEAASTTTGNRVSEETTAGATGRAAGGWGLAAAPPFIGACSAAASREAVRTTRTFAAIRTLRSKSSLTLCMSRSIPDDGLVTKSIAPSSRAFSVLAAPSLLSELTTTIGRGFVVMICAVACKPSRCGMFKSIVITSGFSDSASAMASRPSFAWPITVNCSSELKIDSSTLRMKAESSTTSTRNFLRGALAMARLSDRHDWTCRLRSDQLFHRCQQLIFLHRLGQKRRRAFLHGAVSMFCARARSHHHHRYSLRGWALPQLRHQFVPGHSRHLEVGDHHVASVLRHKFRRFQSIRRQFHAVTVLFQHPAHEFPYADRVVRNHNHALLIHAVDRFRRNRAPRHGRRTRRKYARSTGTGLHGAAFVRLRRHHAVQIDQQDQAAIGGDRGSRKELYSPEIFAQVLDNDFIFAEHFFNHHADLPIPRVCHYHAEISIDGFKRRQPEIRVQPHNFRHNVAHLGQQFSANVLNFIRAQPPDLLHHRQRQRKMV